MSAGQQPGWVSQGGGSMTPTNVCWNQGWMWVTWGTWPYVQKITEQRYWCANQIGGAQTYRTSHIVLGDTFSLCSNHDAYGFLTSGGNGYTWATVRGGGHFDCPTAVPYIVYHYHRWMEYACNTWGNCSLYNRS